MVMQSPKIVISELGKEDLVREMTTQEIAELEVLTNAAKERRESEEIEKAAKAAQRQALLAKLGITEDEARLLLGGN